MNTLLSFFEETTTNNNAVWTYVIMGVMIVAVVLMMIIPQRRNKKRAEEMMSKLQVGSTVTTIGGIVGEVVQLDEQNIWILTGLDDSKTTMKFLRAAIHSIAPAAGSPEAAQEVAKTEEDQVDEIK